MKLHKQQSDGSIIWTYAEGHNKRMIEFQQVGMLDGGGNQLDICLPRREMEQDVTAIGLDTFQYFNEVKGFVITYMRWWKSYLSQLGIRHDEDGGRGYLSLVSWIIRDTILSLIQHVTSIIHYTHTSIFDLLTRSIRSSGVVFFQHRSNPFWVS